MPEISNRYTIGRDSNCDIRISDLPGHKNVGRVHAEISVDREEVVIAAKKISYQVFVNRFKVNRKKISLTDEISIGRNFKFKLHHYFTFKGDQITGLRRRENDFTEEFNNLENNWKANWKKQKELKRKFTVFDLVIIGIIVAISIFTKNRTILFSMPVVMPLLYMNNDRKRKKINEKIKAENICPKCNEYIDAQWKELKQKGGHTCGAFWHKK